MTPDHAKIAFDASAEGVARLSSVGEQAEGVIALLNLFELRRTDDPARNTLLIGGYGAAFNHWLHSRAVLRHVRGKA